MPKPKPKRPRGRPPGTTKWGEPKTHNVGLSLTETAYKWLKSRNDKGGASEAASDLIEEQARK
jgi:hypothetical protein